MFLLAGVSDVFCLARFGLVTFVPDLFERVSGGFS